MTQRYEIMIRKDIKDDGVTTLQFNIRQAGRQTYMDVGTLACTHEEARDITGALRMGRPDHVNVRVLRGEDVESLSTSFPHEPSRADINPETGEAALK